MFVTERRREARVLMHKMQKISLPSSVCGSVEKMRSFTVAPVKFQLKFTFAVAKSAQVIVIYVREFAAMEKSSAKPVLKLVPLADFSALKTAADSVRETFTSVWRRLNLNPISFNTALRREHYN